LAGNFYANLQVFHLEKDFGEAADFHSQRGFWSGPEA
jgi:hypothetical protein